MGTPVFCLFFWFCFFKEVNITEQKVHEKTCLDTEILGSTGTAGPVQEGIKGSGI